LIDVYFRSILCTMIIVCKQCAKEFSRVPSQVEKSEHHFCSRSCSATYNNRAYPKRQVEGKCRVCNIPIPSRANFCSRVCKQRDIDVRPTQSQQERRKKNKKAVVAYRQRQKRRAVEYLGGECQLCGYDRCIRALAFHHLDPTRKDFAVSHVTYKWERIREEVDKCILVCTNCHAELHA
jgi:hypothetical protein